MGVEHPVHRQVFHADHAVGVDDLAALLMGEVLAPPADPLMHSRNDTAVLAAFGGCLLQLGVGALHLCQRLFLLAKEARVRDLAAIGERGKGFESHINANRRRGVRQPLRLDFAREADVPLPRRGAFDGAGFDRAAQGTVGDHLDAADLGEAHAVVMREGEPCLGILDNVFKSERRGNLTNVW